MGEGTSACLSRKAGPSMAPGSRATEVFPGGRRKARLLVAARPGHEMAGPPSRQWHATRELLGWRFRPKRYSDAS